MRHLEKTVGRRSTYLPLVGLQGICAVQPIPFCRLGRALDQRMHEPLLDALCLERTTFMTRA